MNLYATDASGDLVEFGPFESEEKAKEFAAKVREELEKAERNPDYAELMTKEEALLEAPHEFAPYDLTGKNRDQVKYLFVWWCFDCDDEPAKEAARNLGIRPDNPTTVF